MKAYEKILELESLKEFKIEDDFIATVNPYNGTVDINSTRELDEEDLRRFGLWVNKIYSEVKYENF